MRWVWVLVCAHNVNLKHILSTLLPLQNPGAIVYPSEKWNFQHAYQTTIPRILEGKESALNLWYAHSLSIKATDATKVFLAGSIRKGKTWLFSIKFLGKVGFEMDVSLSHGRLQVCQMHPIAFTSLHAFHPPYISLQSSSRGDGWWTDSQTDRQSTLTAVQVVAEERIINKLFCI